LSWSFSNRCSPGSPAARRAIGVRQERGVAASTASAARRKDRLADLREVRQRQKPILSLLVDDRAGRHFQVEVVAGRAGAVGAETVAATLGLEFWVESVGDERVVMTAGPQVH
jgi:hypothetical protein